MDQVLCEYLCIADDGVQTVSQEEPLPPFSSRIAPPRKAGPQPEPEPENIKSKSQPEPEPEPEPDPDPKPSAVQPTEENGGGEYSSQPERIDFTEASLAIADAPTIPKDELEQKPNVVDKEQTPPIEDALETVVQKKQNENHKVVAEQSAEEEPSTTTSSVPSQQDKVNRLSRLIQNLKQKVERLQNENVQLEEMLSAADAAHRGGSGEISRLESALKSEQTARKAIEDRLNASIDSKNGEIVSLKAQVEASSKQIAFLSESLATKEAAAANADAQRSANESQLIATLRKEMETTESMLEEERKAHAATRRASAQRERELDTALAEAAQSLATMQQTLEQRTERALSAEERCSALETEASTYEKKAIRAEEALRVLRDQLKDSQSGQETSKRIEELELALADARNRASEAESVCSTERETAARLQTEVEVLRRQLLEARATDAADLRRRLQEVTEALYTKQNQLERALADKAAAQLLLERRDKGTGSQSVLGAAEAGQITKRRPLQKMLFGSHEGDDVDTDVDAGIVPTETVSLAFTRLANAPGRLGKAVQTGAHFLDSTAYQAAKLLRRSPIGRLGVFCYIIGMHLFIYLLLHRLQHRAFIGMTATVGHADALQDNFRA